MSSALYKIPLQLQTVLNGNELINCDLVESITKNLDLIITVDTSIGHAAAALGKPTWIMLPNPSDWRWMQDRTDTPWYPSVRLFKQPSPGDWDGMIAQVAQELTKFVKSKKELTSLENIQS